MLKERLFGHVMMNTIVQEVAEEHPPPKLSNEVEAHPHGSSRHGHGHGHSRLALLTAVLGVLGPGVSLASTVAQADSPQPDPTTVVVDTTSQSGPGDREGMPVLGKAVGGKVRDDGLPSAGQLGFIPDAAKRTVALRGALSYILTNVSTSEIEQWVPAAGASAEPADRGQLIEILVNQLQSR